MVAMTSLTDSSKYYQTNGAEYSGHWNSDGEKHGIGTLKFQDGSHYKGQFANGLSSGLGIMTFNDGST